jgi:hypothetical protein
MHLAGELGRQGHTISHISVGALLKEMGYSLQGNRKTHAWVSVGTDHDTASFAVATIRRWWFAMDQFSYPAARELMIMADGGGSNGSPESGSGNWSYSNLPTNRA